jgi:putative transposase
MTGDEAKRLRALEQENGKLKKMLADRLLEIDVLREINAKDWMKWPGYPA